MLELYCMPSIFSLSLSQATFLYCNYLTILGQNQMKTNLCLGDHDTTRIHTKNVKEYKKLTYENKSVCWGL